MVVDLRIELRDRRKSWGKTPSESLVLNAAAKPPLSEEYLQAGHSIR
jgi:hypothetical protein